MGADFRTVEDFLGVIGEDFPAELIANMFGDPHNMPSSFWRCRGEFLLILLKVDALPEVELQQDADVDSRAKECLKRNTLDGIIPEVV